MAEAVRDIEEWEVIVVGAGPAGSMAALGLARAGHRVLLTDRAHFPRAKVCGSCLGERAVQRLRDMDLGEVLADAIPARSMLLRYGRSQTDLPARGVVLSREALDWALVQAAVREGVSFRDNCTAAPYEAEAGVWRVTLHRPGHSPRTVAPGVVVCATGLPPSRPGLVSPVSRLGAGTKLPAHPSVPSGVIQMHVGEKGYVGLVRLEDGRIDAAAALQPPARGSSLAAMAATILASARHPLAEAARVAPWKGTPLLTVTAPRLAQPGLFLAGDAASYVEPFTGEGITWALEAGAEVVPFVRQALAGEPIQAAADWERHYRRLMGQRQRVCRVAGAVLRTPWLARLAIQAASRLPGLAMPILRHVHGTPLVSP